MRIFSRSKWEAGGDGPKREAVQGAGAMCGKRVQMPCRAITLMRIETIHRVIAGVFYHQAVTGDFGDDRRGGNGRAAPVAAHQSELRNGERPDRQAVNQGKVGRKIVRQIVQGDSHGFMRCPQNVDVVNHIRRNNPDAHAPCEANNRLEQGFALRVCQRFGIRHAVGNPLERKHDTRRNNRPRECAAPRLIYSSEEAIPILPRRPFLNPPVYFHQCSTRTRLSGKKITHALPMTRFLSSVPPVAAVVAVVPVVTHHEQLSRPQFQRMRYAVAFYTIDRFRRLRIVYSFLDVIGRFDVLMRFVFRLLIRFVQRDAIAEKPCLP